MRGATLATVLVVALSAPARAGTTPTVDANEALANARGDAAAALARQDYPQALVAADRGLRVFPNDPWLLYDRGSALIGAGRAAEAVPVLTTAEARFADVRGKRLAAYRRATALIEAGRCTEAHAVVDHYASLARRDAAGMADARRLLLVCVDASQRQNVSGCGAAPKLEPAAPKRTRPWETPPRPPEARSLAAPD